jgi:hypothetical protein
MPWCPVTFVVAWALSVRGSPKKLGRILDSWLVQLSNLVSWPGPASSSFVLSLISSCLRPSTRALGPLGPLGQLLVLGQPGGSLAEVCLMPFALQLRLLRRPGQAPARVLLHSGEVSCQDRMPEGHQGETHQDQHQAPWLRVWLLGARR